MLNLIQEGNLRLEEADASEWFRVK
jgi:hypothetical protein